MSEGQQFELLARVSERIAHSLDPAVTVQAIADAVVPAFADWCVVDLIGPDRSLTSVGHAHRDPALTREIETLRATYPPADRGGRGHAIYRAIDADRTVLEVIRDDDLVARAVDDEHLALLRRLGIGSHVVAALEARGRVIGAISLIRRPDRPPFEADDIPTAEDIARRAALATDNAQLHRAAQEAIALRDRFIAVASHELRNPLAVVTGHWELLGRRLERVADALPPGEAERVGLSLQRLGQGIEQLRRMVEELLDVSRMSSGRMALERTEVDLGAVVRQVIDDLEDERDGERLVLRLPEEPVIGSWDRGRLEQVVSNLVGNALKYSPPDGDVTIDLASVEGVARLRVTDAGIGVSPDELEAIFEPFHRATNAEDHHYPGLGLGLAVSREIVTRHGGRLWAESEGEGRGSTFIVELVQVVPGE